jgi:DNA-directed RNA polymerase subunit M/transcription elongation factor TFIIS
VEEYEATLTVKYKNGQTLTVKFDTPSFRFECPKCRKVTEIFFNDPTAASDTAMSHNMHVKTCGRN